MRCLEWPLVLQVILGRCTQYARDGQAPDENDKRSRDSVSGHCSTEEPNDVMVPVAGWCVDKYENVICDGNKTGTSRTRSCFSLSNRNNSADELDAAIDARGRLLGPGFRAYSRPGIIPTK